ncbi:MAG TPA: hypothetical protein VIC31_06525, partial [Rudaea sp.]
MAGLNFALWAALNRPAQPTDWSGRIASFSYTPYQRYQNPNKQIYPNTDQVEADIKLLSKYTNN